jgi:signal transduction histidine kinase
MDVKRLERSLEFKELFMDIMSHDLLIPLTIIKCTCNILSEDGLNGFEEDIRIIERNTGKLQKMVENAAKYARLHNIEELEFEERDLREIIKEVVEDMLFIHRDRKIVCKLKGKCPAPVNPFIEDVFSNLLSNAIKYSPKGSEVIVDLLDEGRHWKVAVKDYGEGVPDEYKEGIFRRFERASKKGVKGTGLGLAIVKRIIDLHHGKVWVEDNPEGGSIFYVRLPKS